MTMKVKEMILRKSDCCIWVWGNVLVRLSRLRIRTSIGTIESEKKVLLTLPPSTHPRV